MKVSIIVPIHNVEKYLEKCMESLLAQEGDIEILLIENNSTDGTLKIAKKYEKECGNVRILTCKATGAGAARNLGAREAKGEYIWFVDGDDKIENGAVKELVEKTEGGKVDFVMVKARKVYEDGYKIPLGDFDQKNYKRKLVWYGAGPWQFFLNTKWFRENELWFPEGVMHEDVGITPVWGVKAEKVAFSDNILYSYMQREKSTLHTEEYNPKQMDIFSAVENVKQRFSEMGIYNLYHDEIEYLYIWHLISDVAKEFSKHKDDPRAKAGLERIRQTMKTEFPRWRKNKYYRKKGMLEKMRLNKHYFGIGR